MLKTKTKTSTRMNILIYKQTDSIKEKRKENITGIQTN